jgi:hypothetical protein
MQQPAAHKAVDLRVPLFWKTCIQARGLLRVAERGLGLAVGAISTLELCAGTPLFLSSSLAS